MNFVINRLQSSKGPKFLLHGSQAHLISPDSEITNIPIKDLDNHLQVKRRPILLLACPFVLSFVHETIHLTAKELKQADQQILPFGNSKDNRSISSIVLNKKKALTIHSHLTKQGISLLRQLRANKIRVSWQPAVCYLIKNILYFQQNEISSNTVYRVYLSEEVLQIQRNHTQLEFSHLHYWLQKSAFEKRKQYMEILLKKSAKNQEILSIEFQNQVQDTANVTSLINALFFPGKKKKKLKTSEHRIKRQLDRYLKLLTPRRVLTVSAFFTLFWAIVINVQVSQMKKDYTLRTGVVKDLQHKSTKLSQISKIEREYFKLISAFETADELKINPHLLLNKLDSVLPKDIWINNISISYEMIELVLHDPKETELSDLIEAFSKIIGKTNLEKNEVIQIDNQSIKKYTFTISSLYPGLLNEKMAKR